jgi:hypothetical protein
MSWVLIKTAIQGVEFYFKGICRDVKTELLGYL